MWREGISQDTFNECQTDSGFSSRENLGLKKSEKCFRLLSFEFDPFYIQVFNAHASAIFRVYSDDFGIESGEIPCFSRTVNTEWEKLRIKSALIGPSWTDILIALNLFRLRRNTEQPNTEHRWVVAGKR